MIVEWYYPQSFSAALLLDAVSCFPHGDKRVTYESERREIMKKTKRTLMCLMLAVLLVASCAITAMAASGTGEVVSGNTRYSFNWSVSCSATEGVANISTTGNPAAVNIEAFNYLYSEVNKKYGNGITAYANGYGNATAKPNNILVINNVYVPSCIIKKTTARFYVVGEQVAIATAPA